MLRVPWMRKAYPVKMTDLKSKLLYLGSDCRLSNAVLIELINKSISISKIVVENSVTEPVNLIPTVTASNKGLKAIAFENNIPFQTINANKESHWSDLLKSCEYDIGLSICFEKKIPDYVINSENKKYLNFHPSQLPLFKGPDPLFWQLKHGLDEISLSLHQMNNSFDDGNVVARCQFSLREHSNLESLEILMASRACELIVKNINNDFTAYAKKSKTNKIKSSYYSWPSQADLEIDLFSWQKNTAFYFLNLMVSKYPGITIKNRNNKLRIKTIKNDTIMEKEPLHVDKYLRCPCKQGQSLWFRRDHITML